MKHNVIMSGNPTSHAGSCSKQTHAVHIEPVGTSCKHWNISINIPFLSKQIIKAIYSNIAFIISASESFNSQ